MDQLDILKSKWKSQASDYPTYSTEQLTGLIAKKSSSIVKWIFYIGIAEFVLLTALNLFMMDSDQHVKYIEMIGETLYYGSYVVSYTVIHLKNHKDQCIHRPHLKLRSNRALL